MTTPAEAALEAMAGALRKHRDATTMTNTQLAAHLLAALVESEAVRESMVAAAVDELLEAYGLVTISQAAERAVVAAVAALTEGGAGT